MLYFEFAKEWEQILFLVALYILLSFGGWVYSKKRKLKRTEFINYYLNILLKHSLEIHQQPINLD
jgi:hypothetical protein